MVVKTEEVGMIRGGESAVMHTVQHLRGTINFFVWIILLSHFSTLFVSFRTG